MLLFNFFLILLFSFPYYFNTSNVTIQLLEHLLNSIFSYHFNTSNVTIQLVLGVGKPYDIANFNTSNVTIQHLFDLLKNHNYMISIHLMLLFNEEYIK